MCESPSAGKGQRRVDLRGVRREGVPVARTEQARAELGENDGPMEDELAEAFDTIVSEGAQRLHRTWREVLTTGLAGGLEVATGVVALLAVYAETGSHLLAGLAFGIGFIALMLARSELFTEGFLVPVTAVVAGRAGVGQLAKLWGGTLVANLVGGWLVMWLVVHGPARARGHRGRVGHHVRRRAAGPAVGLPRAAGRQLHHAHDPHAARRGLRGREGGGGAGRGVPAGRARAVPLDPGLADHLRRAARRRPVRLRGLAGLVLVHGAAQHGRWPGRRHAAAAGAQQGAPRAGAGRASSGQ